MTRWDSQLELLNSILKNQQALWEYFQQSKLDIDQKRKSLLIDIVNDYSFWKKLSIVKRVLNFIHKIQYMFEIKGHKLHTMTANWNKIRSHLYFMTNETDEETNLVHIVEVIWENRYLNQTTELHMIAALLLSQNHVMKMIEVSSKHAFRSIMHRFFHRYLDTNIDAAFVMKE